jgi:hypothetical protein
VSEISRRSVSHLAVLTVTAPVLVAPGVTGSTSAGTVDAHPVAETEPVALV